MPLQSESTPSQCSSAVGWMLASLSLQSVPPASMESNPSLSESERGVPPPSVGPPSSVASPPHPASSAAAIHTRTTRPPRADSSPVAGDLALAFPFFDSFPFVVELLALGERDLELDPRSLEVELERDHGHALLGDAPPELRDLV